MGLSATIGNAVAAAFKATGDLKTSVKVISQSGSNYDPDSGTEQIPDVFSMALALLVSADSSRQNVAAQDADSNRVSPQADLTALIQAAELSFVPKNGDLIEYSKNSVLFRYEVVDVQEVPSGTGRLYKMPVKRISSGS